MNLYNHFYGDEAAIFDDGLSCLLMMDVVLTIWYIAIGVTTVILLNQALGTNPIGRTIELFSLFFKQERKRKINVNDMIEGYNTLHDDK
jgi:hypothetical protein